MAKGRLGMTGIVAVLPCASVLVLLGTPPVLGREGICSVSALSLPCTRIGSVGGSFLTKAFPRGDLDFGVLAGPSVTRGDFAAAILSIPPARLGPHGGTLRSCEVTFAELMPGAGSVPSGHAFITVAVPKRKGLDWHDTVMMGDEMVVILSFNAFTRNELLIRCLASCAVLGMAALVSRSGSVMS